MGQAQGSITIRRRPKDGNDGQDAVRYWLVPSANTIKKSQSGAFSPAKITCQKFKQSGNNSPIETTEGVLRYKVVATTGVVSGEVAYPTGGITIVTNMASLIFTLYVNNISVASETVPVLDDGQSCFKSFVFKRNATQPDAPTGGSYTSPVPSGWSDGIPDIDKAGNPVWMSSRVFTSDGKSPQTANWSTPMLAVDTNDLDLEWSSVATNPGNPTSNPNNWHNTATSADIWMAMRTCSNGVWSAWQISKIKGEKGDDSYLLDLTNEMAGIACNSSGTVTGTYPSSTAVVYKGGSVDTGWSFELTNTNCTATISTKGVITITAISADTASILVTAKKTGCPDLTATMSLYKVKPGSDGTSPTIYSIEPNVNAVSQNASGTLSPSSITVYKYAQTGNATRAATTKHRLVATPYNKSGVAQASQTLSTDGGSSSGSITVLSSYSAIDFVLYNGSSTTVLDRETVPVVRDGSPGKDGEDGEDGADATSYWLILNTEVVRKSGTTMTPSTITCKAMMKKGDEAAKEVTGLSIKYKRTYTSGTTATGTYNTSVNFSSSTQEIYFHLDDANGNELACATVIAVSDGEPGAPGSPGIDGCICRVSEWAAGVEYRNDEALTSGTRYLDIVVITESANKFTAYKCLKTHTSSTSVTPENSTTYWQKFNNLQPVYTPLIMAQYAVLQFAQTNQLLISNSNKITGGFGGGNPALWLGAEQWDDAPFRVNRYGEAWMLNAHLEGSLVSGNPNGQRVEIQPENKAMVIYDANGDAVSYFEGNSYTSIGSLFGGTSGTFTMNDTNKNNGANVTGNNTSTQQKSATVRLCSAVYCATPIEVTVSGSMYAYASPADTVTDTGSGSSGGTTRPGVNGSLVDIPQMMAGGSATLILRLSTYSNAALTTLLGSTNIWSLNGQSGSKLLSNARAKSSVGGYHVLEMYYHVSASGNGKSASVAWGTNVANGTTFSGSYLTDFYVSRFFANGFCLGKSSQNYLWAYNQGNNGMRMMFENNGYGLDLSHAMPKIKHHSGSWVNMPMFLFHGLFEFSSSNNTYTLKNQRSWNGYSPTISRTGEGMVTITLPASWTSALSISSLSDLRIILTPLGYSAGSSTAPIKATLRSLSTSSFAVDLSDDASRNDGSFLVDIDYLGN